MRAIGLMAVFKASGKKITVAEEKPVETASADIASRSAKGGQGKRWRAPTHAPAHALVIFVAIAFNPGSCAAIKISALIFFAAGIPTVRDMSDNLTGAVAEVQIGVIQA